MRENPLAARGAYCAPPDPRAGIGLPLPEHPIPALGPSGLQLCASLLASLNPFTRVRLCSELNLC